jgi:hypothetical protein
MAVEQYAELVLKGDAAMMRCLPNDVSLHRPAVRMTDRERSVPLLPLEKARLR